MSQRELLAKLKEWPQQELERFAAQLLVLHRTAYKGSITIHYDGSRARKVVDQPAAATREI